MLNQITQRKVNIDDCKSKGTLAIDLGSTTTVVAFQAEDSPNIKLLDLPPLSRVPGEIPTLLSLKDNQEFSFLFGQEVQNLNQILNNFQQ